MNWLDLLIVALLLVRIYFGLKQGLIRGALSLAGAIVGVLLASNFYLPLAEVLAFIPHEAGAKITAFGLILLIVEVATTLPIQMLTAGLSRLMPGFINRIGGAAFGFLVGVVQWSAVLAGVVTFFGVGLVAESWLAQLLLDKAPLILALLPAEFDAVRGFFK